MRIFITGSTGFIGSRVLEQLLAQGTHTISALVRSEAAGERLKTKGVEPVFGDLKSLDVAAAAAKKADAVLHLAFIHDFSKYMESIATDLAFTENLISALNGESSFRLTRIRSQIYKPPSHCDSLPKNSSIVIFLALLLPYLL